MWDPKFYTKLKVGEMVQIFKGDDNIIMPHILRRLTILQEVGKVLLDRYDGTNHYLTIFHIYIFSYFYIYIFTYTNLYYFRSFDICI